MCNFGDMFEALMDIVNIYLQCGYIPAGGGALKVNDLPDVRPIRVGFFKVQLVHCKGRKLQNYTELDCKGRKL